MKKKIAFWGTGLLGRPMAQRLLDGGFELIVYNRTAAKAAPLKKRGVRVVQKPAESLAEADLFITMLTDYAAITDVFSSVAGELYQGKSWLQMSTISPEQSQNLADRFNRIGKDYMEAPVLGSIPQAKTGTLLILWGGSKDQYNKWKQVVQPLGQQLYFFNAVGQAAAAKLALNQLIATLTAAFSMSLGYIRENHIPVDLFMDILQQSALYAPTFTKKLARMMKRNFANPNFPVKHLLKDVKLIGDDFSKTGINTSLISGLANILTESVEKGDGDQDYSALYNILHPE